MGSAGNRGVEIPSCIRLEGKGGKPFRSEQRQFSPATPTQAVVSKRACSPGPTFLRSGTRLAGSPGSAVFSDETWKEIIGHLSLSHREGEIVRGVFEDHTEFAIAADLGISPHTVHTHFERLHKKLGVANRVQLVLSVTQEGMRVAVAQRAQ